MMAAATVDMNRKIIWNNLDLIEEQRRQMYHAVDQYVDKVINAGRQWTRRRERSHSTFLEIHKITSKATAFLSLKCEEMKSEFDSETSHLIGRDEFTQQQKNAQIDSVAKPATTHGYGKEDDTDDVKKTHTSRNPNLESDQQTRYQHVYNQQNMKFKNLREDTESLKSDVGAFNQYVETGKTLMKDYSQKLETLENTVSCLSEKYNEMYLDQQVLVDRINSHLSDKGDQVNTDLSAKVDQIATDLTDKVDQIATDVSAKVDQISLVLQTLTDSEKEHAAQMNKIIDLEKHLNMMEKDAQNNDKQVQEPDELEAKLLIVSQKLIQLSLGVAEKNDFGVVGFNAETTLPSDFDDLATVGKFESPAYQAECQFDTDTGIFTASSQGLYLAYVSLCPLDDDYDVFVRLIHEHSRWYDDDDDKWQGEETQICSVLAKRKGSTLCNLGVIAMEEDETLFIRNAKDDNDSCRIQFLCVRIG